MLLRSVKSVLSKGHVAQIIKMTTKNDLKVRQLQRQAEILSVVNYRKGHDFILKQKGPQRPVLRHSDDSACKMRERNNMTVRQVY